MKKLGWSKLYRKEYREFLCDGLKLLHEALESDAEVKTVITSTQIPFKLPEGVRVFSAEIELIDSLSPLKNAQDLLFTCGFSKAGNLSINSGVHVLLDCVQDPGNVGTIIRSASAFAIDSVLLTDGCADIYNPKTIRATMGAIFKQPVFTISTEEISKLKSADIRFIGTSNGADSTEIKNVSLDNSIIILGNEGQGISNDLSALCEEMIKIPVSSSCESLNVAVAASIIMWEASKCRS